MSQDSAPRPEATSDLLAGYRPRPGVADELFDAEGRMRPAWCAFVEHLSRHGPTGIEAAFARGTNYLSDAGVYFRHYATSPAPERDWPLSPVPVIIHAKEWAEICAGLAQRADLLEAVVADLYGPGALVSGGHLPAELIARAPGWLRPMVGVRPASGHFLHLLAFEISRNPDGSWFVLGDRAQAPSGAGFALENRMATMRVFNEFAPRNRIHRLAAFFRSFRDAIEGLSGPGPNRAAILTPGPNNASYYEHTYIARYLGLLLLEGEDMLVQNGQVMVRTVEGLQPLSALWRRVDSEYMDPLELREDSQLGTPALISALRQGNLNMINALGTGVLEMRAMMAFLPRISEVLTGAPLKLPNIATWWCGQPGERDYVKENVKRMMIGGAVDQDLPFDIRATTAVGGSFRSGARISVEAWIDSEGAHLVGQEAVTLSTSPVYKAGRLVPRPMTVRVTAARTPEGWVFMPGGYARIGGSDDATALAMQQGGGVADVWVLDDAPVPAETLFAGEAGQPLDAETLPSRAAENLYWLGRYTERAEMGIRLVRAYHLRLAETGDPEDPRLEFLAGYMSEFGLDVTETVPSALSAIMTSATLCASKLRDRFATDGWLALQDLARTVSQMERNAIAGDDCARAMGVLLRKVTGFSGLIHENMYRFHGWRFLSFARGLEQADAIAAVLATFTDPDAPQGAVDLAVEIGDSVMSHRRRYRTMPTPESTIDLLACDPRNPRSILFQLDHMVTLAAEMPGQSFERGPSEVTRALLPLQTRFAVARPGEITAEALQAFRGDLADLSNLVSSEYLR
ncbi:circularly permuted type 2 ATP-grasp protein [Litorisediminicola beolgyonensis]|uniref:Circularly permuted type 2 ATP-grasp protein n=1 Tax=Litorisediminicola beolgyonensis TaxID=1173614 RepID=A0ABW3ZIJ4_9RHOB